MIPSRRAGIRLTFLGKFVVVIFAMYVAVTGALALFLIDRRETAVETNEAINAAGQISALATRSLAGVGRDERVSALAQQRLRELVDKEKRLQYVLGMRIVGTGGRALFPAGKADRANVRHTL